MYKIFNYIIIFIFVFFTNLFAEVVLDGTINIANQGKTLYGNIEINQEYGKLAGTNLFHSFSKFNINTDEKVSFKGSNSITNVISRVTGGTSSWIDGQLISEIDNANFYLLNPQGIIFGKNAAIKINGSVNFSSADYLKFEKGIFDQNVRNDDILLLTSDPSAFGFLDNVHGNILIEGQGLITKEEWEENPSGLHASTGCSISFIGGDIKITNGTRYLDPKIDTNGNYIYDDQGNQQFTTIQPGEIKSPQGKINLVSVKSSGLVNIKSSENDLSILSFSSDNLGDINISNYARIDVGGDSSGDIFIRSQNFYLENGAAVSGDTNGNGDGGNIYIKTDNNIEIINGSIYSATLLESEDSGNAGIVILDSSYISLINAEISCESLGGGNSGGLQIFAKNYASIESDSKIYANTIADIENAGNGGDIFIDAGIINIINSNISSQTQGTGKGGTITLYSKGDISILNNSLIEASSANDKANAGSAGDIELTAKNIYLESGGRIDSRTGGGGSGGNILFNVQEDVFISGKDTIGDASSIRVRTLGDIENAGDGGNIDINANNIFLSYGGFIGSESYGTGNGGYVYLNAVNDIIFSGTDNKGYASKVYTSSEKKDTSDNVYAGNAGNIRINANNLTFLDGGGITASTMGKGKGGSIFVDVEKKILLEHGNPHGENIDSYGSGIFARSESVEKNAGNSGDIYIESESLHILDGALITTSTLGGGNGGNISLKIKNNVLISGVGESVSQDKYLQSQIEFLLNNGKNENNYLSGIFSSSENQGIDAGSAGQINLTSSDVVIMDNASISTASYGNGKAGNINLTLDRLTMKNKASILSSSNCSGIGGDAGRINIISSDYIKIFDKDTNIKTSSYGSGNAGDIILYSGNIMLDNNAEIISAGNSFSSIIYKIDSFSELDSISKKPGDMVQISTSSNETKFYVYTGKEWLQKNDEEMFNVYYVDDIEERNILDPCKGDVVKVNNTTRYDGSNGSSIFIFSGVSWEIIQNINVYPIFDLSEKNSIDAKPGDFTVLINENGEIDKSYMLSNTNKWIEEDFSIVKNPIINYYTDNLNNLSGNFINQGDRAYILNDTIDYYLFNNNNQWIKPVIAGQAGTIEIKASNLIKLNNNSSFSTMALGSGGGKISIKTNSLNLSDSLITASVEKGYGKGGDINTNSDFVTLNDSDIIANAVYGDGGAIWIITNQFIKSENSKVTASSERGNNGVVKIDSPEVDVFKGLAVLPQTYLDSTKWLKTPCGARTSESVSRLIVEGRDATPTSLNDWQPSPPVLYYSQENSEQESSKIKKRLELLLYMFGYESGLD